MGKSIELKVDPSLNNMNNYLDVIIIRRITSFVTNHLRTGSVLEEHKYLRHTFTHSYRHDRSKVMTLNILSTLVTIPLHLGRLRTKLALTKYNQVVFTEFYECVPELLFMQKLDINQLMLAKC